jgi:hypothetical protein
LLKRVLIPLCLSAAAVLGLALPAQAKTASFDWNGLFAHRLDSRDYSAAAGTHTITKTTADCVGPGDQMRVRLVRNAFLGDFEYPFKTWDCTDDDQSRTWTTDRSATYHFTVEKNDTDDTSSYWYVTGTDLYPI